MISNYQIKGNFLCTVREEIFYYPYNEEQICVCPHMHSKRGPFRAEPITYSEQY